MIATINPWNSPRVQKLNKGINRYVSTSKYMYNADTFIQFLYSWWISRVNCCYHLALFYIFLFIHIFHTFVWLLLWWYFFMTGHSCPCFTYLLISLFYGVYGWGSIQIHVYDITPEGMTVQSGQSFQAHWKCTCLLKMYAILTRMC
jgi:hypothetical protein